MKNIKGNLWDGIGGFDVVCITTNGCIKSNGQAVMGRGCALEATQRYPEIQSILAKNLKQFGNIPTYLLTDNFTQVWSFPTKQDWKDNSDIKLIAKSCEILSKKADENNWKLVLIPRPGCNNGRLNYKDVEPILQQYLDDRFYIVTF